MPRLDEPRVDGGRVAGGRVAGGRVDGGRVAGGRVVAVARAAEHRFSKTCRESVELVAGLGVAGDAHAGATVQHQSRLRRDPTSANLRQVHLLHAELLAELGQRGFDVDPGQLGENITTTGVDLLALSTGTVLRLGDRAAVRITGLRNPCRQIAAMRTGLLAHVLVRAPDGAVVCKAGVMSVVLQGGVVSPGDRIVVEEPTGAHQPLLPV